MIIEKIKTDGIAHLSYMIIDGGTAAVIDPRRDIEVYLEIAQREGAHIRHVFETHRNEDLIVGSRALAERTGAEVHHGRAREIEHAGAVAHGDCFDIGAARLKVLETPGHTLDSICLSLADTDFSDEPVAVFTGDTLFVGDVGRTDFFPDRMKEMAGKLYDSLFDTLLPLGDGVLFYPAHGAGSVCGNDMASREFSTLGYERRHNPRLQLDRDAFIAHKVGEKHYQPPYFERMEAYNADAPAPVPLPHPEPMNPDAFAEAREDGLVVLDLRSPEAFCGAHVPGALSMPVDMIPPYLSWFVSHDEPIGLVMDDPGKVDDAVRALFRVGYENVKAYLWPGMIAWEASGADYDVVPTMSAHTLKQTYDGGEDFVLLDVRSDDEFAAGHLPGAEHIYLGYLPDKLDRLPRDKRIVTFCGSGTRAAVAAAFLLQKGFTQVSNCLGSMAACKNVGCEICK